MVDELILKEKEVLSLKLRTLIYVIMSTFLFSSMEIALKIAGGTFNPIQLNFVRFLLGGLLLLPFTLQRLRREQRHLTGRDVAAFSLTGFSCVLVSMTLYQLAIQMSLPATIAILLSANPAFGMLIGLVLLKEKMSRTNTLAVILTLAGLLVIVNPFNLTNPMGITLGLLSSITFAIYGILTRLSSNKLGFGGMTMTCFSFIAGAIELGIFMAITHIPAVSQAFSGLQGFSDVPFFQGITWSNILLVAYISFFVTGLGFGLYFLVMEEAGVPIASLIFFIKPALAPILSLIVLGDPIHTNTIVGIIIILIGSVVTLTGERIATRMSRK
ncbi:DMT family transporter [Pediococcus pentosaceus]|uniref:DMT family transporter n=1 Tax=Pediococcus pentosaceus TaxID=1255 RepID=UPI0013745DB5|nr:DMT family transporter [Pediococcus pentosaceus]MCG7197886.1 DMT family transporter [Pediococcus pentosaceus]MCI2397466.1 DMT family transporter [Pediococcus pentosaceus]MCS8563606.1 EamA family transporter [Pediococcus pentosaceus]MCS8568068.1 EamA family transporter [Pediococcus pentosaceus]MCS8580252.1 EamA family transporter [Pediococcus pentosaceus]